jgi:hypothetical protein
MGARLPANSLNGSRHAGEQQQRQQQEQEQGQEVQQQSRQGSVWQRVSAALSFGSYSRRRQGARGESSDGSAGGRLQTRLSPVYSLGDELDDDADQSEGAELLQGRAS